jgi:hypothetical protein
MAITTMDGVPIRKHRSNGFLRRVLERIGESQMRKAQAVAKPHLLALDDESLAQLGHKREEIQRWESLSSWV